MASPLRIVFVSYEFPPGYGGGIGTYVAAMSRILAQRGHGVTVLTVTDETLPRREVTEHGVEVVRLPAPRGLRAASEPTLTLEFWQARADQVAAYLGKLIRAERVDVIEFPDYRGEGAAFLCGRTAAAPATDDAGDARRPILHVPRCTLRLHTPLTILNRYNRGRPRFAVQEAFENEALLAADAVLSPSAALAREVAGATPGVRAIELLPYPVDPAVLGLAQGGEPARRRARESDEVLYVGRLEERKGVETLIRAAPALLAACPGARLRLVGADTQYSPAEPSMRERLERLIPGKLAHRIIFEDALPRDELLGRYGDARVCVFPSLFENFPNVCLEAMAAGRVVVGSDNSGMAEMIEHGVSGLIARAGDADHLARTVAAAWAMPEPDRRAMGEAARRRILDAYHPDTIAAAWERASAGRGADSPGQRDPSAANGVLRTPPRPQRTPKVAVVIPCYNHGRFVAEALASVRAQTWPAVETVIVDDGSTDPATVRALDELSRLSPAGLRVIRQQNAGLAAARNAGVRATDAEFFVPLDADDLIEPAFIERLIRPLLDDPALGYCYCHAAYFGASLDVWPCPPYDAHALLVANQSTAAAVVRRRAFDLAGGYSRDMRGGFEDWDFWVALLAVGYRGRCVPEPLFRYRKHEGGSMLTETQRRRPELIRRMIEHHRDLYALNLDGALVEKDTMFFRAHMDAWEKHKLIVRLRGEAASHVGPAGEGVAPEIVVRAREELERILGSRSWRAMGRIKRSAVYRAVARARWGDDWERALQLPADPCAGLDRIKGSRSYRMIQLAKLLTLRPRLVNGTGRGTPRAH